MARSILLIPTLSILSLRHTHASMITFTKIAGTNTAIPMGSGTFTNFGGAIDGESVVFTGRGNGQRGVYKYVGGVLSRVADTNSPVPGGTTNFVGFDDPSISGGNAAFYGWEDNHRGVFTDLTGTVTAVADSSTPIPAGTGNFTLFAHPCIDGSSIAFLGWGDGPSGEQYGQKGIYINSGGVTQSH